ncbi:MAG: aminopeptidase P N-terminal domain-containing protein [Acidobacteriota bacterium]|nr:MAG: aminopeptidase P N-terminal domain-containing protein [Acidobacteriota bacterium]
MLAADPSEPGICGAEFASRRQRVLAAIDRGVMILAAGSPRFYSADVEHRFRPEADFLYLTGFREPRAVLVLRPDAEHPFTLFVRERDARQEAWTGLRAGPEGAVERYGADEAFPLSVLPEKLASLLDGAERLFYSPWRNASLDQHVRRALTTLRARERLGTVAPAMIIEPGEVLHEMRRVKSAAEISLLEKAAAITSSGHRAGIARCTPGVREYQIQAAIEAAFRDQGAEGPAFGTIVAAGSNGCVLHYVTNQAEVRRGQLVLVDAGAEVAGYNADVTRTFPASGRFTPGQRALYDTVLDALQHAIDMVRPGMTLDEIHRATAQRLTAGLVGLGVLAGAADELLEKESFKKYFLHRTSHWLGMDVHDVGRYQQQGAARRLHAGMLLTVEPGLYIPPDDTDAPKELRGQAVRIEDDLLVTDQGARVLTRDVPVDGDEIAALVGARHP